MRDLLVGISWLAPMVFDVLLMSSCLDPNLSKNISLGVAHV